MKRSAYHAVPGATERQGADVHTSRRHVVELHLALHCTPENTQSKKVLKMAKMPESIGDMKELIQSRLQIPVCCQKILFESVLLRDSETLHFHRIQENDTLHVHYNSEADISDILEIIDCLKVIVAFLTSTQDEISRNILHSSDLDRRIARTINSSLVESLAFHYFYPSGTDKADANRRFFIANEGLQLMHEVHMLLLHQPWSRLPLELQYLEHAILRTLWNITACFSVREEVLLRPTLQAISRSFLRIKVERSKVISAPCHANVPRSAALAAEMDRVLSEVVYKAVGTLCNLAEIPRCRQAIAANPVVLTQMVSLMLTPTYKYIAPLVTTAGFLCLAYSPETHPFLATPEVVEGVMDACEMRRPWCRGTPEEIRLDRLLLRYFAAMFFAQLVSCSLEHLSPTSQGRISLFMDDFLQTADYKEIRLHEVKNGYIWSTLVPFLKLVYLPHTPAHCEDAQQTRLRELCIEAGVFSLQNMLSGEEGRAVLVEEGLVEYVTCMPWHIPKGLVARGRAHDLVAELCQKSQLQPPRLSSLARGKLAVMCFGLEKMLGVVSVQRLLADVCNHKPIQ